MLLAMLVLLDSILQMQLFQINQSEDSSKITIMSDTTCGQLHHISIQLHQRPIITASLYKLKRSPPTIFSREMDWVVVPHQVGVPRHVTPADGPRHGEGVPLLQTPGS